LAFFFGLEPFLLVVELYPFTALAPFVALAALDPLVAALDPFVVDLDRFIAFDLAPFVGGALDELVVDLDPFVALLPLVDLEPLVPFVAAVDPFIVDLDEFSLDIVASDVMLAATDVVDLDLFVLDLFALASCAARIAKSSCLLEQPVASKICLMVGEVSSSMVAREELEAIDDGGACDCDAVMEKAIELFVGTFFLVTYGLRAVLCQRRD